MVVAELLEGAPGLRVQGVEAVLGEGDDTGRLPHDERQTILAEALDTALAHHDTVALDTATDVLRRLAEIYDRL